MDYNGEFDPRAYLGDFYRPFTEEDRGRRRGFSLKQYYRFFETYSCKWDKTSSKILEFGAGPVLSNVISAVPYANEIVLASYTESERRELTNWQNGTEDAYNWNSFFKHIVEEIESKPEESAWKERVAMLRSRLTITSCDINLEHPIAIGTKSEEMYTVVCTNLCLEAACKTYEDYKTAVKKLGKLVQLGGYLVMLVVERETFYMTGGSKWFCLYLTLEQVKLAMEEAGFDILFSKRNPTSMEQIQKSVVSDVTSTIFIVGLKVIR